MTHEGLAPAVYSTRCGWPFWRPILVHAELHTWPRHLGVRRRFPPPPSPHVEVQVAGLVERGLDAFITPPTYARLRDAKDLDPVGPLGEKWCVGRDQVVDPLVVPEGLSPRAGVAVQGLLKLNSDIIWD
ncbi:hypothetical protein B0H13DRAFT_1872092 [Mycena leptocephala]|nr:hypothetical protein B0H13DRAFT_1880063 [Mycena leptocephala]KAJ7915432.1 hypothetical protein B0H13DRAFT_1872092 [Mycena leptocephala]